MSFKTRLLYITIHGASRQKFPNNRNFSVCWILLTSYLFIHSIFQDLCDGKNEEDLLMETYIILDTYIPRINAFKSSHREDMLYKIVDKNLSRS